MTKRKRIRTLETKDIARMNRWCARCNRLFGVADDCLMANGYTAVRWNKKIKLVLKDHLIHQWRRLG